jgi:HlyD family secretion protein
VNAGRHTPRPGFPGSPRPPELATFSTLCCPLVGSRRVIVLPLLAAALTTGCGGSHAEDAGLNPRETSTAIPAVEVVQSRRGALPLLQRLTGTVRARGEVAIYPQTSGAIVEVFAQNGQSVHKGEPLVRIQAVGSQAQLEQARSALEVARAAKTEAEANLARLEAQYRRNAALGEEGLVPVDTVATLRTQMAAARAAAARAAAEVSVADAVVAERADAHQQLIVRAPIAGRVGQRNAEVGMRVDEQTALFIVGRLEQVRVEVPVTQEILTRVRRGQRVEIGVQGSTAPPIVAEVARISPFLAPGSYSAEVEVDVANPTGPLVSGMFVTATIFYGESEQATLVPASAIYDHPATGEVGVYLTTHMPSGAVAQRSPMPVLTVSADKDDAATDDRRPAPIRLHFRAVEIVAEGPQTTGIRGVEAGAWVVVVGQHLLSAQAGEGPPQARVRRIAWDRILDLQRLQRDDLLRDFMDRQQRLARQRAAPDS